MKKKHVLGVFCLALLGCLVIAQQQKQSPVHKSPPASNASTKAPAPSFTKSSSPQAMTSEEAFFYYIAIFGAPGDYIDRYGSYFDAGNYNRAMADEFSRNEYRDRIRVKIMSEVSNLNFGREFVVTGPATLGEYSFAEHAFPVNGSGTAGFCIDAGRTFFGNCVGGVLHVDVFSAQSAVNNGDFTWALEMPESEASAFIKSRALPGGGVNRTVTTKITYTILRVKGPPGNSNFGQPAGFKPFIHSVEVFADPGMGRKLGTLAQRPGIPESGYGPEAMRASVTSTKTLGTYKYVSDYKDPYLFLGDTPKQPVYGTITLTDVGVTLSGEKKDGSVQPFRTSFSDSFAARADFFKSHGSNETPVTRLWRANYPYFRDLRVVWDAYWGQAFSSVLIFDNVGERDRFFGDLTKAMQDWTSKYPQFAATRLEVDQRCQDAGGYLRDCSETHATEAPPTPESHPLTAPTAATANRAAATPRAHAFTGSREAVMTYMTKCQGCHGGDGTPNESSVEFGVKPASDPSMLGLSQRRMVSSVKNGKGKMRGFKDRMTDQEIEDAVAYFRSLQ